VKQVDARGMRCPWPALRLAKAMREADAVTILADDPRAAAELAALARSNGWSLVQNGDEFHAAAAGLNASFTQQA
jgi:tRNA 2-thiouridine synthesizing protein A